MSQSVTNNTDRRRFELIEEDHTAYADYKIDGGVMSIKYVFSPEALRGKGTAGRLMEGITAAARADNLKILPICGYAASWLRRHDAHKDLIA